jgi:hypothetical protein
MERGKNVKKKIKKKTEMFYRKLAKLMKILYFEASVGGIKRLIITMFSYYESYEGFTEDVLRVE